MTPIPKGAELWIWPGGMLVGSVILGLIVHYVFYLQLCRRKADQLLRSLPTQNTDKNLFASDLTGRTVLLEVFRVWFFAIF
jgi:hypothetical protein